MKIVFLCVANSARSQMAEGLARAMVKAGVEIISAGSQPTSVNPFAVEAMREIGIDITTHRSKSVAELNLAEVDAVITLCADEVCPVFQGKALKMHWPFEDPASAEGLDTAKLAAFRRIRNKISERLEAWLSSSNLLEKPLKL
jgi:arsenate reductase